MLIISIVQNKCICSIRFLKQMETTMQTLQSKFQNLSDQILAKNIFSDFTVFVKSIAYNGQSIL